jgi:ketosteroid isomerase-like protein
MSDDLERRLARLEDREQIRELVARYGYVVDARDIDGIPLLFTPDGRFRSKDGVIDAAGRPEVVKAFHGRYSALTFSLHWTHDVIVELDPQDPDRATGIVGSHAEVCRNGVPMVTALRYDDVYRRHEGRWRFADRLLSFVYYVPVGQYIESLGATDRMRAYETPRAADLPESLPAWQDYGRRFPRRG